MSINMCASGTLLCFMKNNLQNKSLALGSFFKNAVANQLDINIHFQKAGLALLALSFSGWSQASCSLLFLPTTLRLISTSYKLNGKAWERYQASHLILYGSQNVRQFPPTGLTRQCDKLNLYFVETPFPLLYKELCC